MNKPELVFYNGVKLSEATYWDRERKLLYFAAIRYNTFYELDPEAKAVRSFKTDGPVGGVVTDRDGNFITAEKTGIYKWDSVSDKKTLIAHVLPYPDKMRYNHLILDSKGRILVDVMGDEERCAGMGGLYIIDGEKTRPIIDGATVANGVQLSSDEKKLYFTDTPTKTVMEYDYDIETGNASNGRVIITIPEEEPGKPDGLMLGKDGDIYIAEWASGLLTRYDIASGRKLSEMAFPSAHVTSTCYGGENDEYIYVATAKNGEDDPEPSGGIFRIKAEDTL